MKHDPLNIHRRVESDRTSSCSLGSAFLAVLGTLFDLSAVQAAGRASCPPVVQVEGEPALREPVLAGLRRSGVQEAPLEGCPLTRVRLQYRDAQISIELYEAARQAQRIVSDADTAIAVIESWVRSDLSAPLLIAPPSPPPERPSPPTPVTEPVARPRTTLGFLVEVGSDVMGRAWLGGGLRGCGRVGRLCLGAAWRTAGDLGGDARTGRHLSTEVLAIAALPIKIGPLYLTPSLGLGVAWVRTTAEVRVWRSSVLPTGGDGSEGSATENPIIAEVSVDQGRLQGEARLEIGVPLPRGFSFFGAVALSSALTGHAEPVVAIPDPAADLRLATQLPAVPWGVVFFQLGTHWSAR